MDVAVDVVTVVVSTTVVDAGMDRQLQAEESSFPGVYADMIFGRGGAIAALRLLFVAGALQPVTEDVTVDVDTPNVSVVEVVVSLRLSAFRYRPYQYGKESYTVLVESMVLYLCRRK